jgi:hypothetical protein
MYDPSAATLHGRLKIHLNRGADVSLFVSVASFGSPSGHADGAQRSPGRPDAAG